MQINYDIEKAAKVLDDERAGIDAAYAALVTRQRFLEESVKTEAAAVALHLKELKAHHKQLVRAIPRRLFGFVF
jgi:hypothetical protein